MALKQMRLGDNRYKVLYTKIQKLKLKATFDLGDPYLIEKNGIDDEFKDFGISSFKILPEASKKLLDQRAVLKHNFWLCFRSLLGPTYRADIAFVRLKGLSQNAYEAMKLLKCSKETSYRNWKALSDSDVETLIRPLRSVP